MSRSRDPCCESYCGGSYGISPPYDRVYTRQRSRHRVRRRSWRRNVKSHYCGISLAIPWVTEFPNDSVINQIRYLRSRCSPFDVCQQERVEGEWNTKYNHINNWKIDNFQFEAGTRLYCCGYTFGNVQKQPQKQSGELPAASCLSDHIFLRFARKS